MNEYDTLTNSYSTLYNALSVLVWHEGGVNKDQDYIMHERSECTTTICNQDFYWLFYHCGHSSNIHYLFNGYVMTYIMSYYD